MIEKKTEIITFDKKTYQNQMDIYKDLLAAAQGNPHTTDPDLMKDPKWWTDLFFITVKGSFLQQAAGDALFELAKNKEPKIRKFAIECLAHYPFAKGEDLLLLLQEVSQKKEIEFSKLLAFALTQTILEKRFSYSKVLREFANMGRETFFWLYFIYDGAWLQNQMTDMLSQEESEANSLISRGFEQVVHSLFSSQELSLAYEQMKPALGLLPKAIQVTISSLLQDTIAKKHRLENARFHNFRQLVEMYCNGTGREALEGFDEASLCALVGEEKEAAVDIFIEELERGRNDPRICSALGAMKSERAVPTLKKRMQGLDETAAASAHALWSMQKDKEALDALLRIAKSPAPSEVRTWALSYLREELSSKKLVDGFSQRFIDGLLDLLSDQSADIRHQALDMLSHQLGVSTLGQQGNSRLFRLSGRLLNELSSVWQPVVPALKEIFIALQQGKSPEMLDLLPKTQSHSEAFTRLQFSVFGDVTKPNPVPAKEVDVEAFLKLQGEEQAWGEQWILQLISDQDKRGLVAVQKLNASWALSAIEEASTQTGKTGKFAQEAKKVRDLLKK